MSLTLRAVRIAVPMIALLTTVACSGGPSLQDRIDELSRENEDLNRRNVQLEGESAANEAKLSSLQRERTKAPKETADLELSDELSSKGVNVRRRGSDTVIDLPSDVFFGSGSAVVSKDGEHALREILTMIKKHGSKGLVRVEGHSDADPIRRTKSKYHCNWELSFERAHAVAHYLVEKGAVDPHNLAIDCFGEYQPLDAKNKAKNRRVEIVIAP